MLVKNTEIFPMRAFRSPVQTRTYSRFLFWISAGVRSIFPSCTAVESPPVISSPFELPAVMRVVSTGGHCGRLLWAVYGLSSFKGFLGAQEAAAASAVTSQRVPWLCVYCHIWIFNVDLKVQLLFVSTEGQQSSSQLTDWHDLVIT